MATVDIKTYLENGMRKKSAFYSAMIAPQYLTKEQGLKETGKLAVNDKLLLAHLPDNSVITKLLIYVNTAPTAGTAKLKIEFENTALNTEVVVGATSNTFLNITGFKEVFTGIGGDLTATITTAELASCKIDVIIELAELRRTTLE